MTGDCLSLHLLGLVQSASSTISYPLLTSPFVKFLDGQCGRAPSHWTLLPPGTASPSPSPSQSPFALSRVALPRSSLLHPPPTTAILSTRTAPKGRTYTPLSSPSFHPNPTAQLLRCSLSSRRVHCNWAPPPNLHPSRPTSPTPKTTPYSPTYQATADRPTPP
ncbi:hypothetical protein IWX90DRAFT_444123 [Phyllosticta citrichinensis]|uniref:Uncharacterized protein n=1 Tax=Phyllosticta citrichinensis TaxID=1130410 RepID=A0ABR1XHK1_9PEZI